MTDALISSQDGKKYWESIDADVNGMLGGFPQITKVDLQDSRAFLAKLGIGNKPGRRLVTDVLEGGAGIGRVTEGLLLPLAANVDVIEPVAKFTDALQAANPRVRHVFNVGLQDWEPAEGVAYDLVWTQWCVGHLTDPQLVAYLERCKAVLRPGDGVIVVKENLSTSSADVFDGTDSSVTREDVKFRQLFKQAGLQIVRSQLAKGIPKDMSFLLPIMSYALKPIDPTPASQ